MTYVKIHNTLYPATITGQSNDYQWGGRESKTIRILSNAAEAVVYFVDDVTWSIVEEYTEMIEGVEQIVQVEYDNSDFCLVGDKTTHRDNTISVKMGKLTDAEVVKIITGGNE